MLWNEDYPSGSSKAVFTVIANNEQLRLSATDTLYIPYWFISMSTLDYKLVYILHGSSEYGGS